MIEIDNPVDAPDAGEIDHWEEAVCSATIMTPKEYYPLLSNIGSKADHEFYDDQVIMKFEIALSELIGDFFDQLKSTTSGYASIEYKVKDYKE
jgi:GTP-binding protein LepA